MNLNTVLFSQYQIVNNVCIGTLVVLGDSPVNFKQLSGSEGLVTVNPPVKLKALLPSTGCLRRLKTQVGENKHVQA